MYQEVEDGTLIIQTTPRTTEETVDPFTVKNGMLYDIEDTTLVLQTGNRPETDHLKSNQGYYTVAQVIGMHDEEFRNQVPYTIKLRYLEEIERRIQKEVIDQHETPKGYVPMAHFIDFGDETILYVYSPYHIVYIYYIELRIAQIQNDTKRINMLTTMYNDAMITYQQEYRRNNKRKAVYSPYYDHRRGGF